MASFVPAYSGVAVLDSHEVPLKAFDHLNTLYDYFLSQAQRSVKRFNERPFSLDLQASVAYT